MMNLLCLFRGKKGVSMKNFKEEIKMSVFLIVLTTLCTSALAGANYFYEKALAIKEKELRMDILKGFGVSFDEENFDTAFNQFVKINTYKEIKKTTFYYYDGEPKQVAIITSGNGLWSVIDLFIFVDINGLRIKELKVLSHGETPGLGGKIEESGFLDQFKNLDISEGLKIVKEKTGQTGEVDAITGATRTSDSVEKIINNALSPLIQ